MTLETIKEDELVSVNDLSRLSGFPVEMIQKELFQSEDKEEVSLKDLRSVMIKLIDKTMLEEE